VIMLARDYSRTGLGAMMRGLDAGRWHRSAEAAEEHDRPLPRQQSPRESLY
jgi:hypothetical protein